MKILLIHSDFIEFEPRQQAIKDAEEWKKGKQRIKECLVVFTAAEKQDDSDPEQVAENTQKEIEQVSKDVKCKSIVLYPYVHLTQTPSNPSVARKIMEKIGQDLTKKKFKVSHAPFGWYKSFDLKCKGHPLAELSRSVTAIPGVAKIEDQVSGALKQEEKVKSEWYILTPAGKLNKISLKGGEIAGFDFSKYKNLEKFANYEMAKVRAVKEEPPHVKLMKKLEMADYEPGSDPGNLRYYPAGRLVKSLLEEWITRKVIDYGAMEVESPVMYDFEHPALKDYLNRFPARQYSVESAKKKFFLRFSACFGQFLMNKDMNISYRNLPFKMYELTRYSFRLEKAGELTGLRRLRAFTMPDMHTLCPGLKEACSEFKNQFKLSMGCMEDIGFEKSSYETGIRFTKDFWKGNRNFIISLVKLVNRPVLIEMWNFRYAYFDPKFEFNFIDALDKASALATVQIDHENAKRYGITYTDKKGGKKYPIILHCSPSGGIERCMYAMLEKAWMKNRERATLPLWLSPVQVRICPVNDFFVKESVKIADKLEKEQIRVDIDDRVESVSRKILDAETKWVPLTIVLGKKEKKTGKLAVRFRKTGKVRGMKLEQIVKYIKSKTRGLPYKPLPLPRMLTKRPVFVG